jgi:hypothetical protein
MVQNRKLLFALLQLLILPGWLSAQEDFNGIYRYSVKADFSVPTIINSRAFRQTFSGIYDIDVAFITTTRPGICFGPGFKYALLKAGNNRNASLSPFQTRYDILNPYLHVGYQHNYGGGNYLGFLISAGMNRALFSNVPCDSLIPPRYQQFINIEPSVFIRFHTGENSSFGARIGYNMLLNNYNPNDICVQRFINSEPEDIRAMSSYISFGLGFSLNYRPVKLPIRN